MNLKTEMRALNKTERREPRKVFQQRGGGVKFIFEKVKALEQFNFLTLTV